MYLPELHHFGGSGCTKRKGVGKSKNKRLTGMLWQSQPWRLKIDVNLLSKQLQLKYCANLISAKAKKYQNVP